MRITAIVLVVVVSLIRFCLGQTADRASSEMPCQIIEMLNRDGWVVPGLLGAKIKKVGKTGSGADIDGILVEILEPGRSDGFMTLIACVEVHPNRVVVKMQAVDVTRILRFSLNDRVFGYQVTAVRMGFRGSRRYALSGIEILYYYDPDGSGKLTVARYAGELNFRPLIPDWVKTHTPQSMKGKSRNR